MYGSDWPVAEGRGKCISLGDSFIWLTPDNIDLFARYSKDNIVAPALIGFETLRALKQACDECDRPPRDSRTWTLVQGLE
jgi:glutamate-1-semialdehyde 2,1-aminomutase